MSKPLFFLSLGSNLGDRAANLAAALDAFRAAPGVSVLAVSRTIETEPEDVPPAFAHMKFLNLAAAVSSDLPPYAFLGLCLGIEKRLGRTRPAPRNSPRPADIDIACCFGADGEPVEICDPPELVLPHPRAAARAFVLDPLSEIAPEAAAYLKRRAAGGKAANAP